MGTIKDKIILLVDDEPAILQMCQSILEREWFWKYSNRQYSPERIGKNECKAGYGGFRCYAAGYGRLYVGKDNPGTEPDPYSFLTAKGEIDDKSKGFEVGADDYMVKPFIAQEFVWRITAILRRTYKESEESSFFIKCLQSGLGTGRGLS